MSVKSRVSTTPNSVVRNPEVQHQWNRAAVLARYTVSSMSPQCWPRFLTTCCVLTLYVVRKKSGTWSTIQSCAFLTPEWTVHVLTWSPRGSNWNFLQHKSRAASPYACRGVEKKNYMVFWTCLPLYDLGLIRRWQLLTRTERTKISQVRAQALAVVFFSGPGKTATGRWVTKR